MRSTAARDSRTLERIRTGEAKTMRERAGYDLLRAGLECSVYPSTVLRWETGAKTPRSKNLEAYGQFLDRIDRQMRQIEDRVRSGLQGDAA